MQLKDYFFESFIDQRSKVVSLNPTPVGSDGKTMKGYNAYDLKVYSNSSYGTLLKSGLQNSGNYSYEVSDFGKVVVVRATYSNIQTGKQASKIFVILFEDPKSGKGHLMYTSTKGKVVGSPSQAASQIKSMSALLLPMTQGTN